ncbi:hypothetical protein L9F63_024705 [Diploptera punctata]|uniref:Uncharacterized protein n=1 Tax=Diploptera punctata TaxID=6984 RepID=A0AAD7ZFW6_DIPPU|nr:hypothetical protein L9F63_024705 [Diploptera punctata]
MIYLKLCYEKDVKDIQREVRQQQYENRLRRDANINVDFSEHQTSAFSDTSTRYQNATDPPPEYVEEHPPPSYWSVVNEKRERFTKEYFIR